MSERHKAGRVIVINGPSVAGKSSVQRRLQELFAEPYMAMGLDTIFCGMLPQRYFSASPPANHRDFCWGETSTDESGAPVFTLRLGPQGRRVFAGMHEAIAAFARRGNNVIMDHIFYEADFAVELARALDGIDDAYLIGVRLPLEVLEARERARETSPVGHARSHYATVHAHGVYDLEIDTEGNGPEACAAAIMQHVESQRPRAFAILRRR